MWHPKKKLDPFLPVFSHFFMSYFDVFDSIFEKSAMTDLPNVIVSICLVSYNICMIPHVWTLTLGLNLSGAWGGRYVILRTLVLTNMHLSQMWLLLLKLIENINIFSDAARYPANDGIFYFYGYVKIFPNIT